MPGSDGNDSTNSPYLPLQAAINLVPTFNGTNIPINSFIRKIEQVKSAIHARDIPLFTTLVSTKIEGPAENYIQRGSLDSLSKLFEDLKRAYSTKQLLPDIQTQISQSVQKQNESALEFGIRIEKLVETACEVSSSTSNNHEQAAILNKFIKDTATRSFIKGLTNDLEYRVGNEKPCTLREAIDVATRVEKLISERKLLESFRDAASSSQTEIKCKICKQTDHVDKYCPKRRSSLVDQSSVNCRYCKKRGHSIENCETKQRNSKYCTRCQRPGHVYDECRTRNFGNQQTRPNSTTNQSQNDTNNRQNYQRDNRQYSNNYNRQPNHPNYGNQNQNYNRQNYRQTQFTNRPNNNNFRERSNYPRNNDRQNSERQNNTAAVNTITDNNTNQTHNRQNDLNESRDYRADVPVAQTSQERPSTIRESF